MSTTQSHKARKKKHEVKLSLAESSKKIKAIERIVPDTSAIINHLTTNLLKSKEVKFEEVILHRAMLGELENQANQGREIGHLGLEEVKALTELADKGEIKIRFEGTRPLPSQIRHAKDGEIDALIRDLAEDQKAALLTSDTVQAEVAEAVGMNVIYIPLETKKVELSFVKFFKKNYMSVHLKENQIPLAKAGIPGTWEFETITKTKLKREELEALTEEIVEHANTHQDSYIEIERPGSIIAQIDNFRIVITRPPFSDGWEITIVRPVKKLTLEEYNLSDKLSMRLATHAEGILIAGKPGEGKSTFCSALAITYSNRNKIVKTLESPRDLALPDNITQFSISRGTPQEIHDILLLTRPDYTVFDEMRNTPDFKLYGDLRLAGVGMIGVMHATQAIDAIQRFIGRIELGMIAHVIDTVIFIKNGQVNKVLDLSMKVKVPSGMTEADLARPVIEVRDFETDKLEFEVYTYGEETVVLPVATKTEKTEFDVLLEKTVKDNIYKKLHLDPMEIEKLGEKQFALYVLDKEIPRVIGTGGERIRELENALGVSLDVRSFGQAAQTPKNVALDFNMKESKKHVEFFFNKPVKRVSIYVGKRELGNLPVGRNNSVSVAKKSKLGRDVLIALREGKKFEFI